MSVVPVPDNGTEPLTLPARFKDPAKVPTVVGANVTSTLHVADGARVAGQLFVSVKLGSPEIEMLLIVSAALPVENICICPVRVCPSATGLKLNGDAGLKTNAGATGADVVPVATTRAEGTPDRLSAGAAFVTWPFEPITNEEISGPFP